MRVGPCQTTEVGSITLTHACDEEAHRVRRSLLTTLATSTSCPGGRWGALTSLPLLRRLSTGEEVPLHGIEGRLDWLSFSGDGRHLAAGSRPERRGGQVSIHELPSGRLVARIRAHLEASGCGDLSPDGALLATCDGGSKVMVWSADDLQLWRRHAMASSKTVVTLSTDGKALAVADLARRVHLLDPRSGKWAGQWRCAGPVACRRSTTSSIPATSRCSGW